MNHKRLLWIPVALLICGFIASILAYRQDSILDQGFLHSDNSLVTTTFSGTYDAILGNIQNAVYVDAEVTSTGIVIELFDENVIALSSYELFIAPEEESFDASIVSSIVSDTQDIEELDEYLFSVLLEEGITYQLRLTQILGSTREDEQLNVVLVHIDATAYNRKAMMESVSYTTLILSAVSLVTILLILKFKD